MSSFWYRQVLPLGHNVESVRHTIVAVGSAHRLFMTKQSLQSQPSDVQYHEHLVLQLYNSAIAQLLSNPDNIHVTLVCCVLFVCLESMIGRYEEALRHLSAGIKVLGSFCASQRNQRHRDEQLRDIAHMLYKLWVDTAFSSDQINGRITASSDFFRNSKASNKSSLQEFSSLEAAQRVLSNFESDMYADFMSAGPAAQVMLDTGEPITDAAPPCDKICPDLVDRFRDWSACFDRYVHGLESRRATHLELQQATFLSLRQSSWQLFLAAHGGSDVRRRHAEHRYLKEMLERAEKAVSSMPSPSRPVFAIDGDITYCLVSVISASNDINMQKRALALLRSMRRREGIWDSQELAEIHEAAIAARTAARNIDPGTIPGGASALVNVLLEFGVQSGNGILKYVFGDAVRAREFMNPDW